MGGYFFDSSALVKRYVTETGSIWISDLFDPALANEIIIAAITPVEIIAAITRRARTGTIHPADAQAACGLFRADIQTDYVTMEFTGQIVARAMNLAESHSLRGYDAVQLASALEVNVIYANNGLPPLTFSADQGLNTVAAHEGLAVEDPKLHP